MASLSVVEQDNKLKLYSYWRSSCSFRVRIALNLKGLKYEYKPVNLLKGENSHPEFLELNPVGFVPVLVDGHAVISDSFAIIMYLEDKYPHHPLLPSDIHKRAINFQAASIVSSSIQPLQNLSLLNYIEEKVSPDEKLPWAQRVIRKGFTALEKLLKEHTGKYATGDEVFLADIFLAPQLYAAFKKFNTDKNEFPILSRLHETYYAIPAFREALPENQPDAAIRLAFHIVWDGGYLKIWVECRDLLDWIANFAHELPLSLHVLPTPPPDSYVLGVVRPNRSKLSNVIVSDGCQNVDLSCQPLATGENNLKLYSHWMSSCSFRVRFALNLKGLKYEYEACNLQRISDPEFQKLNPVGYVPVLVDGDVVIVDSFAIIMYLEDKYPHHPLLPHDIHKRAINFQVANIVSSAIQPFQNFTVAKYIEEKVGPDEKLPWTQSVIGKGFTALEKLLKDHARRYATGDEIFLADLFLAPQLYAAVIRFNLDMKEFPILSRLYEAYNEIPAFREALPENQPDAVH
ncbi:Thioredoxin-like superfamily [Sesbania bispinosa]|nr:Thioredoxin-like superfamily [Sesbania bispinosa]